MAEDIATVGGITVLCHFHKDNLKSIISCLPFWSLFHVTSNPFCPITRLGPIFIKENTVSVLVW